MTGDLVIGRDPDGLRVLRADRVVEISLELLKTAATDEITGVTYGPDKRFTVRAVNGTWVYRVTGPAGPQSMWAALESGDTNPPPVPVAENDQGPDRPAVGDQDQGQEQS